MQIMKKYIYMLALLSSLSFAPATQAGWWDDVGNWFNNATTSVGNWFVQAAEDVGNWFEDAFDSIEGAFNNAANFFEDAYETIETEVVDAYHDVEGEASGWFTTNNQNTASNATSMTVQSYDLNTSDSNVLTDFRSRQSLYVNNVAAAGHDLVIDAYLGNPLNAGKLTSTLSDMLTSKNSDFALLEIVRVLYYTNAYDTEILAAIDQLPKWIDEPGGEKKMYNSENHLIMWMVANWLLDQRAGVTPSTYERNRLEHWMDLKINYGFYEFASLTYAPYTLAAMLNLYDFASDAVIKEKARKVALIMISDYALFTTEQRNMYHVSGRDYSSKYETETQHNHTIGRQLTLLFGGENDGRIVSNGNGPVDLLATTTLDVSPATRLFNQPRNVTYRIGHNASGDAVDILHAGLNATDKALFQMSAGAYAHPDFLADMVAMYADLGIDGNDEAVGMLSTFIGGPLAPIIGGASALGGAFTYSSLLMDQTVDVYKDGGAMLTSLNNYHGGRVGWQQQPWSATTGGTAVFTRSGSNRGGWDAGGQAMMNVHLPYIQQTDNVALILYKAKPELRVVDSLLGTGDSLGFDLNVNLHWQEDAFDETASNGNWLFGREGDNYVAVFRHCTGTREVTDRIDNVDVTYDMYSCGTNQQVWASVVGTADSHTSFYSFIAVVSAAEISSEWNWDFQRAKHVWQTTISVDGKDISFDIDANVDDFVEGDTWELGSIVNTNGLSIDSATLSQAVAGGQTIYNVDEDWSNTSLQSCTSSVSLFDMSSYGGVDPSVVRAKNVTSSTPMTYSNWRSGEPNNSGNEDCAAITTSGEWNDVQCGDTKAFACRDDAGNWAVTSATGPSHYGPSRCAALGGTYAYMAPINDEENAAATNVAKSHGSSIYINANDASTEGAWKVHNFDGSCQVLVQEDGSKDAELTHADETIDVISFVDTEFEGGEAGHVTVEEHWTQIDLKFRYERPVVFASIATTNGGDPAVVEVRNITSNSFEVRVAEFEYLDDNHASETVSYVVMNAGNYDLGNGRYLEVGTASVSTVFDGSPNFETVEISTKEYQLITQVQGTDTSHIVGTRVNNKVAGSFDVSLMVQEANVANAGTINGVVGYMALGQRHLELTSIKVALKGYHGKYLVAEDNGGNIANFNRSSRGTWETFYLIASSETPGCVRSGDKVALMSGGGYYMMGHSDGSVHFTRHYTGGVGGWETFILDNTTDPDGCLASGDRIYMASEAHGTRLQSQPDGRALMHTGWGNWVQPEVIFIP